MSKTWSALSSIYVTSLVEYGWIWYKHNDTWNGFLSMRCTFLHKNIVWQMICWYSYHAAHGNWMKLNSCTLFPGSTTHNSQLLIKNDKGSTQTMSPMVASPWQTWGLAVKYWKYTPCSLQLGMFEVTVLSVRKIAAWLLVKEVLCSTPRPILLMIQNSPSKMLLSNSGYIHAAILGCLMASETLIWGANTGATGCLSSVHAPQHIRHRHGLPQVLQSPN